MALIANVSAAITSGVSVTSGAVNTSTANLLVFGLSYYTGQGCTVSDSKSNTWTGLTISATAAQQRARIWYSINPTVGTGHTFTGDGGSVTSYQSLFIQAFSLADISAPFDQENGAEATATTLQTGSVTPTSNNQIIVALLADVAAASQTIDSGFTITDQQALSGGVHYGGAMAYLLQGTAAAVNPTWSWGGASLDNCARIATFKTVSAGVSPRSSIIRQAVNRASTY